MTKKFVARGRPHLVILLQVEDVAVEECGGVHLHPRQVGGGAELWLEEVGGVLLAAAAAAPPPGGHAHAGDVEEGDQHPGQHRHQHSETKKLVAVAYFRLDPGWRLALQTTHWFHNRFSQSRRRETAAEGSNESAEREPGFIEQ